MGSRTSNRTTEAHRLALRAWKLLHIDSALAIELADQALAKALARKDAAGEGWARLARGFHLIYFARPRVAAPELRAAQQIFERVGDSVGRILAQTGLARGLWREGRYDESLQLVLALRDEGLAVLRHEQRGLLLNTIAGCYSARNESEQAFAYMYQALRDAPPARGHGYDAVLHCNLAHELMQLGDHDEAGKHVEAGLARFDHAKNPRLASVLWVNRIIIKTELGRASEVLPDIERVVALPTDASGRGALTSTWARNGASSRNAVRTSANMWCSAICIAMLRAVSAGCDELPLPWATTNRVEADGKRPSARAASTDASSSTRGNSGSSPSGVPMTTRCPMASIPSWMPRRRGIASRT